MIWTEEKISWELEFISCSAISDCRTASGGTTMGREDIGGVVVSLFSVCSWKLLSSSFLSISSCWSISTYSRYCSTLLEWSYSVELLETGSWDSSSIISVSFRDSESSVISNVSTELADSEKSFNFFIRICSLAFDINFWALKRPTPGILAIRSGAACTKSDIVSTPISLSFSATFGPIPFTIFISSFFIVEINELFWRGVIEFDGSWKKFVLSELNLSTHSPLFCNLACLRPFLEILRASSISFSWNASWAIL